MLKILGETVPSRSNIDDAIEGAIAQLTAETMPSGFSEPFKPRENVHFFAKRLYLEGVTENIVSGDVYTEAFRKSGSFEFLTKAFNYYALAVFALEASNIPVNEDMHAVSAYIAGIYGSMGRTLLEIVKVMNSTSIENINSMSIDLADINEQEKTLVLSKISSNAMVYLVHASQLFAEADRHHPGE